MIVLYMYVTDMYSDGKQIVTYRHDKFSNSGKVEMYGNSRAVLWYILLSSNYPMARALLL